MIINIVLLLCILTLINCYNNNINIKKITTISTSLSSSVIDTPKTDKTLQFPLGNIAFSLLPLSPEAVGRRKTIITEVVKDKIWTLDQVQGIINVNVPVRCTIIKLKDGLFINNPVAPTPECIQYIRKIEEEQKCNVKYITLASLALEHKGTCGSFSSKFPKASVYLQPGQYSFPVSLPSAFFFPLGKTLKTIPDDFRDAPWADEIEHQVLPTLKPPGVGGFAETAFFHKDTNTLLVTDTIIRVDDEPPAIINEDPRPLLYHARDNMLQVIKDTKENRRKGWRRMVLFALTFQPSGINVTDTFEAIKMLDKVTPEMKKLGDKAIPYDGGLYPWEWIEDDKPNFKSFQGGLLVAPILQKLILNRDPEIVLEWADKVAKWPITRIIPCHFSNDLKATSKDFRKAFEFLEEPEKVPFPLSLFSTSKKLVPFPNERDCSLLSNASKELTKSGVLYKEAPLVRRK